MTKTDGNESAVRRDIADLSIHDKSSFDRSTQCEPVARLYFFFKLDCLIDLSHAVSHDFVQRPELFVRPTGLSRVFARFYARYGAHEEVLDKVQRAAIYAPVFGVQLGDVEVGNFPMLRDELLRASVTYVESQFGDERALRQNVLQKLGLFKEYIAGLTGESVAWSAETVDAVAEGSAFPILRSERVAAVYGVDEKVVDTWPYALDNNAPKLVEKISQALSPPAKAASAAQGAMPKAISREEITSLQRAAIEGATALATLNRVETSSGEAEVKQLIGRCYTWAKALEGVAQASKNASVVQKAAKPLYGALGALVNRLPRLGL